MEGWAYEGCCSAALCPYGGSLALLVLRDIAIALFLLYFMDACIPRVFTWVFSWFLRFVMSTCSEQRDKDFHSTVLYSYSLSNHDVFCMSVHAYSYDLLLMFISMPLCLLHVLMRGFFLLGINTRLTDF